MKKKNKNLLRYEVDWMPVSITMLTGGMILLPFFIHLPIVILCLWSLVSFNLRKVCALHHHNHGHLKTFHSQPINQIYDILLSVVTGFTTSGWELHHNIGHHRHYLDTTKDVISIKRFKCEDGSRLSRCKFTLLGDFFAYPDCFMIALNFWKKGQKNYMKKFVLQVFLQVVILLSLLFIDPLATIIMVLVPAIFFRWAIFWMAYGQHCNTDTTSVYTSCNNILQQRDHMLNIGHHTAHHEKPTLHWSLLPERTKAIMHEIPSQYLKVSVYATPKK